jgi:hypothetical protein
MRFISAAAIAMARPSALEERLRAILDTHRNRGALQSKTLAGTLFLLALLLVPVACLQAQQLAPAAAPAVSTGTTADARAESGDGADTYLLDAVVYEIRVPPEKITHWDPEVLKQQSKDPDAFEKALAAFGKSLPRHRIHQPIQLAQETYIQIGGSVPYITNTQVSNTGQEINSVAYTNIGAILDMIATGGPQGQIEVEIAPQVSTLTEGGLQISEKIRAPKFQVFQQQFHANVRAGEPFLITATNGGAPDADGNAVMFVWRITLDSPKP